jgi:hypothetical protein
MPVAIVIHRQLAGQPAGRDGQSRLAQFQIGAHVVQLDLQRGATSPPQPKTGTATADSPAINSPRATALRVSQMVPNARCSRSGVCRVLGVYAVRCLATAATTTFRGAKASSALPTAVACAGSVAHRPNGLTRSDPTRFSM